MTEENDELLNDELPSSAFALRHSHLVIDSSLGISSFSFFRGMSSKLYAVVTGRKYDERQT